MIYRSFLVLSLLFLACAGAPQKVERQDSTAGGPAVTGDLSRIDHIILGVNDLQKGIEEFERRTGVKAVYGGAHPGRGTHNALASLGEPGSYLEILAPNPEDSVDPELDRRSERPGLPDSGRLGREGRRPAGSATEPERSGDRNRRGPSRSPQPAGRHPPRLENPHLSPLVAPSPPLLHRMGPRHRPPLHDLAGRLPPDRLPPRGPHSGRSSQTPPGGRPPGGCPRGQTTPPPDLSRLPQGKRGIPVKFRPSTIHGTPWRHSKRAHRCDTGKHGRSGDHKRGRRRAF